MKSASKLYGRGTDWSKMTTSKLEEIVNHPYTLGSDGKDYGPYLHELQAELYKRQNYRLEQETKRFEIEFKKQLKALTGKRKSA